MATEYNWSRIALIQNLQNYNKFPVHRVDSATTNISFQPLKNRSMFWGKAASHGGPYLSALPSGDLSLASSSHRRSRPTSITVCHRSRSLRLASLPPFFEDLEAPPSTDSTNGNTKTSEIGNFLKASTPLSPLRSSILNAAASSARMSVVGFDFGNESGTVAVARQRSIDVVLNDEYKGETPDVVCFGDKQRFIGTVGATSSMINPKYLVV